MIRDVRNFLATLSLQKILNILRVQFSYFLSVSLNRPVVWGKPFSVSIEPVSVCNLQCPQCPVGVGEINRQKKYMDLSSYKKIINEIAPTTSYLSLYFQGESLLNKEFLEMVSYASSKRIYTMTSTNGQLLDQDLCRGLVASGMSRIIISMDGVGQESYEKYRKGGDYEKLLEGIRALVSARQTVSRTTHQTVNQAARQAVGSAVCKTLGRSTPYIILQFLVFRHNEHQISQIKALGRELGVDRVDIKTAQIEYPETANQWLPSDNKYSRYNWRPLKSRQLSDQKSDRSATGVLVLKRKLKNHCKRLWHTTVITADGIVVPCCFDKMAQYPMGHITEENFPAVWNSQAYQDFRNQVLINRKQIAICRNCTE